MWQRNILYTNVLELWWEEYKNSILDSTQHKKSEEMRVHIIPFFEGMRIREVTVSVIQEFVEKMQIHGSLKRHPTALAPSTIKGIMNTVKQSLDWAVLHKYVKKNVAREVRLPRIEKKEIEIFSIEDVKKLIAAARPKWIGDIILLSFRTGMRRGEIYGLKWNDIDFENRFLMIRRTISAQKPHERLIHPPKTKTSARRISLDSMSVEMLQKRKEKARSEWVFEDQNGIPLSPWHNTKYMRQACKNAKIPHRCFHTLRHTHATISLMYQVNPKIVQERLGHANIQETLGTYSHVLPTMQHVVVDVFDTI